MPDAEHLYRNRPPFGLRKQPETDEELEQQSEQRRSYIARYEDASDALHESSVRIAQHLLEINESVLATRARARAQNGEHPPREKERFTNRSYFARSGFRD